MVAGFGGGSSGAIRARLERALRQARGLITEPPSPEQVRREAERFFDRWAADIVNSAHAARARRDRGEERSRPVSERSPVEVMGEAVSYGGHAPPETVRRALRETLERDSWPGIADPGRVSRLNAAPREALRRAFVLYAEETRGPGAGE
jgi:hypothetical protein